MRPVDRDQYKVFFDKAKQHSDAADWALKARAYDAAVTNYCISLVNLLDGLSVNRFGKDLNSDNHEAAPMNLQKQLSGAGVPDFKQLTPGCIEVLKMKNLASYRSEPLNASHAKKAREVVRKVRAFVEGKTLELGTN